MRANTVIWLAANNTGDSKDGIECWSGTFPEVVVQLAQWLGIRSMAKRFDFTIGRNEEQAREGLKIRSGGRNLGGLDNEDEEMLAKIAELMGIENTGEEA